MKKNVFSLLAIFLTTYIYSQFSPGGITGTQAWLQGNRLGLGDVFYWQDYSGDSINVQEYYIDNITPISEKYKTTYVRYHNFNPSLYTGGDHFNQKVLRQFILSKTNLNQLTIIGVHTPSTNFNREQFLYGVQGRSGYGFLTTTDQIVSPLSNGIKNLDYGSDVGRDLKYKPKEPLEKDERTFRETATRILTYQRYTPPNTSIWGEPTRTQVTIGGMYHKSLRNDGTSFDVSSFENNPFKGYLSEMIVYDRVLSPNQRQRVESYLAIKYGLTLDKSYIGSWDTVIWDKDKNIDYHHRVTGVIRDNKSGLYQPISTTTYEESYNNQYFSYDNNSYDDIGNNTATEVSYALPSSNRLLTIGLEPTSKLLKEDKTYALWGDNNQSITTNATSWLAGMRIMPRKWKIHSTIPRVQKKDTILNWKTEHLQVTGGNWKKQFTKLNTTDSEQYGTAVTEIPLRSKNGLLRWQMPRITGNVLVKFGSSNPIYKEGANDYGIYISLSGRAYLVHQGKIERYDFARVSYGDVIEMIKRDTTIRFRINGKLLNKEIVIAKEDQSASYYAGIQMSNKQKNEAYSLKDFYHRGFVEDGMQIELSYAEGKAKEFNPRKIEEGYELFLLIDEKGTGDFSKQENLVAINHGVIDYSRKKIIFNNIFLDRDQSGTDVFTFGYKRTNSIVAIVDIKKTTCNASDEPQKDGVLKVDIKSGKGSYTYQLKGINETTYAGKVTTVSGNTFSISGLPKGEYNLEIKETASKYKTITKDIYIVSTCESDKKYPDDSADDNIADDLDPKDPNLKVADIITVYPVPAKAGIPFKIQVNLNSPEKVVGYIYNSTGTEILKHNTGTALVHRFKLGLYEPGFYIFKIVTQSGKVYKKKIIVI